MDIFDSKFQNGLFFGYTLKDSFYRVYNLEINVVEESTNVVSDEVKPNKELVIGYDKDDDIMNIKTQTQDETNVEEPHQDNELEFYGACGHHGHAEYGPPMVGIYPSRVFGGQGRRADLMR